ncbi:hypothetical protein B0H17DRAFT_1138662 [Mycena rosella]|uniref:DUF6589 domain-containing protein n=1 Tax=Mycena rosella TaxID=1033263 RepID=A0AAD7D5S0_MYCRO|nr:hypothetical protein B0H17DRAFT_1138662 [Mycena rosella]
MRWQIVLNNVQQYCRQRDLRLGRENVLKEVTAAFNSEKMAKRCLPKRHKTGMQPLGTNAERETETQGMMQALLDFESQMGLDKKAIEGLIFMPRGNLARHYKAMRHIVPPGPEIWHTRWTKLNAIASNSDGPASATDPSSVSKSGTAAGAKRPLNLKKIDFFPVSRSMELFFEARVLDCWRIWFQAEDILEHSQSPCRTHPIYSASGLPRASWLNAPLPYTQALNKEFSDAAPADMKLYEAAGELEEDEIDVIVDEPGEDEEILSEPEEGGKTSKKKRKKRPTVRVEAADFAGDRVAANEVLFLQDMGWWVIVAHAVPDGKVGYLFCVSPASKDFSNAMLDNWLISTTDHKYEAFKKWLEEMVEHKGGDFDDYFYRHALAPNMHKEDQLHLFRPGRMLGHASVNFFGQGYEKLADSRIAKFIAESTAYSDITKNVLSGEEHDDWDEEMQKKFDAMLQDPDDESQVSDTEDTDFLGFGGEEPEDNPEGHEENEELSEIEEEHMDKHMELGEDLDSENHD